MSTPELRLMAARAQVIRLHHNGEPDSEVFRMAVDDLIKCAKADDRARAVVAGRPRTHTQDEG